MQLGKYSLSRSAIAPFQSLRLWLPVPGGGWSAAGFFRFVLCSVLGPGSVLCSSFSRGSYPTVWFASPSWFALVTCGAFRPNLTKHCSPHLPHLPAQPPTCQWQMQASVLLLRWGSYCWARNLLVLIIYFSFLLCCPLCFQGSPQTQQRECFLVFGNLSS